MPRAFLIKSKKERKKAEGGDENESKNEGQVDISQDSQETRMAPSDEGSQVSEPQTTSDVRSEPENAVKIQTEEEKPAVSEQTQHIPIPRGKTKAKKALKEVQLYGAPQSKKPRKRAPKRSSIYYYNDESDGVSDESERQEGSHKNNIPNSQNYHSPSSAVNCKDSFAERTNSEGHCLARQPQQSRCQENSAQFEFHKAAAQQVPREETKAQLPRIVDDKENQINEGLHNVKIVEYHSISNNIEVVYPDIPRPPENPVPENHNAEKYYHMQSSPTVTTAPASQTGSQTLNGETAQRVVSAPNPAPVAQQPVIHYVPVFAVQGPNGVYYEPVPGAAHVVQSGPPAPYGGPQPGHPQPVQQPPEQTVAQSMPPHSAPQQLPPHQLMQPMQQHQVPPQHMPQQQPQPQAQPQLIQQGTDVHRQRLPSEPGTPPYPVPQPYNPPTSIHNTRVVYSQQPQTMPYPTESPSYAKPVQVAPGLPYPPSTQVAMTTKPYPVPVTVQTPAPAPQPYAVPPQSGHGGMQYPPYPPSSQNAVTPQMYPVQEYPPATQSQVLQHYPHMPTQPPPRQPPPGAVTAQPYPLQPQQVGPATPMYQPSQVSAPYPHSAPVAVTQQPYPANKSSPVPPASYAAPSRGPAQFTPPGNPPHTSQAPYYPQKTTTVPSQQHLSARPVPLPPSQVYPENRNGIPPPQYMPRESGPKFVYAPPPVNFHQSPVYRVPQQSKNTEAAPVPANNGHDKTVTGSKRRKASVPHRGMRDLPSPPDSYGEQPSPHGGSEKSDCHNSPLNKSSCIITPPGSPQDEVQNGEVETYTVVVHDRGIQTRLPEMEPRWCPTKRLWKMEPKQIPPPTQQQQQQPLVESGKSVKTDAPPPEESLSPVPYSPTQKENMYIPRGNSENMQRPHGMRRGRGRKSSSRYHCKFCNKGFQWHSHLTSHERTHTGEKPYECSECSRAFTRADGLQCHMIVHNKKKPFKCQYCSKGFSDNTLLEKHVYSHTGVKPFKCEYCGRAFTDSQSIEKHLLVHTGTKPYKCQYCVRSFNDSQMLVRHIRSHTGEKPYKCRHCPMAFSKQSALVIHTRVHTGEKPYKCPNCPKSFSISGNLQRHILIHTGERPYKCSKCPKAFNNPSHLSRHISKLHAPKALEKSCVAVPMETDTIKVEMAN